jgi:pyridoxamine 5'-phosphate oxidase family protein
MTFTDAETAYLASQRLGRLATIQPDGSPQVKPVGFRYNPGLGTIDVTGFNMTTSQKFRNVRRNGRAALVVDDIASADPWRVRFLEIRGTADAIPAPGRSADLSGEALIRIHPTQRRGGRSAGVGYAERHGSQFYRMFRVRVRYLALPIRCLSFHRSCKQRAGQTRCNNSGLVVPGPG